MVLTKFIIEHSERQLSVDTDMVVTNNQRKHFNDHLTLSLFVIYINNEYIHYNTNHYVREFFLVADVTYFLKIKK